MFQRAWVPVGGVAREASTYFQSAEAASVAGAPQAASAYFSASVIGATPISGGGGSRAAQPTATGIPGTRDFDGAPGHYTVVPPVEYPAEPNASTRPSPGGSRNSPFPLAAQYNMQHGPHSGTMGFKAPSPRTPYGQAPAMQRIQSGAQLNRTPSLQFAMEFDEEVQHAPKLDTVKVKLAIEQMWRLMACNQADERQIQHTVIDAREQHQASGNDLTCSDLAKVLEGMGYGVTIRTALGGGEGADCLRNLRHNFLVIRVPGESSRTSFIVDIDFKAQFAVASPTPHYQALLENMDSEFIGTEDKLRKVIHMMCEEMAAAFKEQEIGLPPWRQPASMLSKWCPRRSADFSVSGERHHPSEHARGPGPPIYPAVDVFATAAPVKPMPWEVQSQPSVAVLADALQHQAA